MTEKIEPLTLPWRGDKGAVIKAIAAKVNELVAAHNGVPYRGPDGADILLRAEQAYLQVLQDLAAEEARPWYRRWF